MSYEDETGIWDIDEDLKDDHQDPIRFGDRVMECPNCKKTIASDHDSCPFCGDILFRYMTDGTFAPPKGPLTIIFSWLIIILVALAGIGLILFMVI